MMKNMNQLADHLVSVGAAKTSTIVEAFRAIDRKDFVAPEHEEEAYEDTALPIGYGQTISQPYTVALMLELLGPQSGERMLDVGSGSGWTTALLAHVAGPVGRVLGVERIPELVGFGRENLAKLDLPHAEIRAAGSELGFPEHAPYSRILASAAAERLPDALATQLAVGGTLVMPIGSALWRVHRMSDTKIETETCGGFAFVPLIE